MATQMRQTNSFIASQISEEAFRFDFFQAARLLELIYAVPQENRAETLAKDASSKAYIAPSPIRFRSHIGLAFPASQLAEVNLPAHEGEAVEMVVNFFGLAGIYGPLPYHITETILESEKKHPGKSAYREFLDIFNHRLLELRYQIRKLFRPGYQPGIRRNDILHTTLFSLLGISPIEFRDRMAISDNSLLRYAGLLANRVRSLCGLESMLADYFQVPAEGRSLTGGWYPLQTEQQCHIGSEGQNNRLGDNAVIGSRVWCQEAAFEMHLGPMNWDVFLSFLPVSGAKAFPALLDLTRAYAGFDLDYDLILKLNTDQIPAQGMGKAGSRLGWNALLPGINPTTKHIEVRLGSELWRQGTPGVATHG